MRASQVFVAGVLVACLVMIAPTFGEDGWDHAKYQPPTTYKIGHSIKISHNGLKIALPQFGGFFGRHNKHDHHHKTIVKVHHHHIAKWPEHDPWW